MITRIDQKKPPLLRKIYGFIQTACRLPFVGALERLGNGIERFLCRFPHHDGKLRHEPRVGKNFELGTDAFDVERMCAINVFHNSLSITIF